MHNSGAIRLACVFLIACAMSTATYANDAAQMRQICAGVQGVGPSPGDRPTPAQTMRLAGCSSVNLYFGLGIPRDPVKARQCAFVEKAHRNDRVWGGSTMLMMIYANGQGAKRNFDYAIKLACDKNNPPFDGRQARVLHLAKLRRESWQGDDFSVCDDATTSYWLSNCKWLSAHIAQSKRNTQLEHIVSGWGNADRQAFARLSRAFDHFVKAHVDNELYLNGNMSADMQREESSTLDKVFLGRIERLQQGALPHFSDAQFAAADRALNVVYRRLMKENLADYNGAVTHAGIRETERAWLAYRDAWVTFGQEKWPGVSAAS